jgi:tetratricopeptide (TPR) repeat protein
MRVLQEIELRTRTGRSRFYVSPPLTCPKGKQAEALYKQALSIDEKALGPEHPDLAYPLNDLAKLYTEQRRYEEAEPLYQRALHIWEQAWGPEHPETVKARSFYHDLLERQSTARMVLSDKQHDEVLRSL